MHIAYCLIIPTAGHDRPQNLQVRPTELRLFNIVFINCKQPCRASRST